MDSMTVKLWTPAETSEMLRTPIDTLRHWRDKGTGPLSIKVGRRVMYREADLLAWLDEQAEKAAEQRKATTR
jgi:DNA-binding transcriptional MerR regulator